MPEKKRPEDNDLWSGRPRVDWDKANREKIQPDKKDKKKKEEK